jgi:hypothetical protein
MAKTSQRQILADIAPVNQNHPKWEGFKFAQVSGGEITASVEKIYEGGAKFPTVLCAPYEIGDITLTAHFDDDIIQSDTMTGVARKVATLRSLVGQSYYNINVKVYDCDIAVIGTDRVYSNALLVGLTEPEGDSSSGAPATFSLTFAIQNVTGAAATT